MIPLKKWQSTGTDCSMSIKRTEEFQKQGIPVFDNPAENTFLFWMRMMFGKKINWKYRCICLKNIQTEYTIFSSFKHIKKNNIIENKKYEDTFNIFKEYKYEIGDIFKNHSTFQYKNNNIEYYWGNIYKYLFLGNFILPSSVVFKKSSLKRVGMLNEAYKVAEETEFFLRFSKYYDVGFINDPLLYYEAPEPDNLSGKKNTERLIKNALKIQIDSIISNQNELETDDMFFKGISITHSRLAYYYLSEYRMLDSRKYALCGIKTYRRNIMPYMIFIISYIPQSVLNYLLKMKHIIADN